jgi:hypothetical protein
LIYENDSKQFALMMKVTWQSYGRNGLEREALRYWFDKLIGYDFTEVSNAFDQWIKTQKELPTVSEILKLCQHKVTIHARIASPLAVESNKHHADNVVAYVAKNIKPERDKRAWARKILDNPKNYPDVSFKLATEALNLKGME